MSRILFLFFFLASISLSAQEWLDVYEEHRKDGGVDLMATNSGPVALSLEVDFRVLKNLACDVSLPHIAVIPAGDQPVRLLGLTIKDRQSSPEYDFRFVYAIGDVKAEHDDDFVYQLPYKIGTSHLVHQGYHGNFSHGDIYALDFSMPIGTEIYAARGGVVANIKEDSNSGCKHPSCQGKANYVVIAHDDGSMSNYIHLKKDGVVVNMGERVEQGQLIGISGNTGWSSGPHLHFEVYTKGMKKNKSLPTLFYVDGEVKRIREGKKYKAVKRS